MFGIDDLISSAFSWGTDALGSALNAGLDSLGLSQHGRDQYFNRAMMREQMDWQSSEAQKNRDYQTEMYERQLKNYPELLKMQSDSDFNRWKNQFNIESSYNSQGSQVARNLVAGINPAAQGSALTQGVSMSPSSSAPPNISGSPVGNPSPVGIPSTGMSRGLLSEIGSFMRDVQQAKNLEKQTGRYDEYMNTLLSKFEAETENKEEATRYQKILTAIKQVYGNTEALFNNARLLQEAYNLQKEGDYFAANKKLVEADENLSKSKKAEIDERLPLLRGEIQSQIDLNKANQKKALNEAYLASQQADYYKAIAKTENDLRSNRLEAVSLENDLRSINKFLMGNELKISDDTMQAQINSIIEGMKQQQIITNQQAEKLYQLRVASSWASRQQYMQYWTGFFNSAANVIGSSSGYYNGALSRMSAKERNQIQREFNDIIDRHYNTPIQPHEVRGFGYQPAWQE